MDELTPTERRVLQLLGQGKTQDQIARELSVKRKTVWQYTYNIRDKTGIPSTIELAIEAAILFYVPA